MSVVELFLLALLSSLSFLVQSHSNPGSRLISQFASQFLSDECIYDQRTQEIQWTQDPCCNPKLAFTHCCAKRAITKPVSPHSARRDSLENLITYHYITF